MDHQTAVAEFWDSAKGKDYGRYYHRSLLEDYGEAGVMMTGINPDSLAIMCQMLTGGSEPMYVDHDVINLLEHALPSFKPEVLHREDIVVPWGFGYLGKTLLMPSSVGTSMAPMRAISWAPYMQRWIDPNTATEDQLQAIITQLGEVAEGQRFGQTKLVDSPENADGILVAEYVNIDDIDDMKAKSSFTTIARTKLALVHYTRIPFDKTFDQQVSDADAERGEEYLEKVLEMSHYFNSVIQVFFRLMQQRIVVRYPEYAPRASWRRSQRAGLNHRNVLVVRLRRPSNPPQAEGGTVDWSHRWIVGGHWRNQWYPSEKVHRQIWISDYEKGPEDKPLVIKERAFNFNR